MDTMEKIEPVKENIVPLKYGRSAAQLAATAQAAVRPTSHAVFPTQHDPERIVFEDKLLASEAEDDPLETWAEYLGWLDKVCPTGHRTVNELVTRLVRHFVNDERYEKSPKFLRIYLERYIPSLADPSAEFAFMMTRGIGRKSASFYCQYAQFLETQLRFADAREVYQRGIAAEAKPAATLTAALEAFEARAANHVTSGPNDGGLDLRPALQALPASARQIDPLRHAGLGGAAPAVVHADVVSAPRRSAAAPSASALNSQLAVFEDSDAPTTTAAGGRRPLEYAPKSAVLPPAAAEEVRKENTAVPTTWNSALVPTNLAYAPPAAKGKPEIFVDNDDDGGTRGASTLPRGQPGLRPAGTLRAREPELPAPAPAPAAAPPAAAPSEASANETVVRKYDYNAVYPTASEEYSFEEIRARAAARRAEAAATAPPMLPAARPPPASSGAVPAAARPPLAALPLAAAAPRTVGLPPAPPSALPQTPQTVRVPSREVALAAVAPVAAPVGGAKPTASHAPSPTINTKFALNEIQGMFQKPLPSAVGGNSPADGDDDSGSFDMLLRGRPAPVVARDMSAALASAEAWRDDALGSTTKTGRQQRALAPFAVTPASIVRPSGGLSNAVPPSALRLDAGLIYEDSDEDGADENENAAVAKAVAAVNESGRSFTAADQTDQENRPPSGVYSDRPRSSSTAAAPKAVVGAPVPLRHLEGEPGPIPQGPIPVAAAAAGNAYDPLVSDFEVYEDPALAVDKPLELHLGAIYQDDTDGPAEEDDAHGAAAAGAGFLASSFADSLRLDAIEVDHVRMPARDTPLVRGLPAQLLEDEDDSVSGSATVTAVIADPFDDDVKGRMMEAIEAEGMLDHLEGYYDCADALVRYDQRLEFALELQHERFRVLSMLGGGAYASVFLVAKADDDQDEPVLYALKFQTPASERDYVTKWDFVMVRRLTARLPPAFQASICPAHSVHLYDDESYLVTDYGHYGTLLNLINMFRAKSQPIPEVLVIFYTVELLRVVEGMHAAGFVHGDIKVDNILVRFDPTDEEEGPWDRQYQLDGSKGWSRCGIQLIDFGRSIDLELFPPGSGFVVHGAVADAFQFVDRICRDQPWRFQIDYFGVCNVVYNLLHSEYMKIVQAPPSARHGTGGAGSGSGLRWRPVEPFKRYWQSDIWVPMFDSLLNHDGIDAAPELSSIRASLETYLVQHAHRQPRALKALLQEQESELLQEQQNLLGMSA